VSLVDTLARRRVTLGFGVALLAAIVADPTWPAWRAGLAVALAGEALRVWAAGHLEKSREVTRSGPYRWMRHPLYGGSAVIATGVIIASRSLVLAVVAGVVVAATIGAAIRREEVFLRGAFGEAYDRYRTDAAEPMRRRFSLARAVRNREHRAVLGLAAGFALLALKLTLSI
jgi:protein-S-isoprenylcysteine O-methyltransferase Ste14